MTKWQRLPEARLQDRSHTPHVRSVFHSACYTEELEQMNKGLSLGLLCVALF